MTPDIRPIEPRRAGIIQKVVVVAGGSHVLEWLEGVLEPGHYEVVFVEDFGQAYSRIKETSPSFVIVCARLEDIGAFQLLTMLKLDDETRNLPVHTYTTDWDGQEQEDDPAEPMVDDPALLSPPLPLN